MSARLSSHQTSERQEELFWRETIQAVIGSVWDAEGCFQELYDHFASPASWQLKPHAAETLSSLRTHGIHLAIASNFDHRLSAIVRAIPELREIDRVVISSELGWRKPHPKFFDSLLSILPARPKEVLMIGDDFTNDIQPARALGIQALHLNSVNSVHSTPGCIQSLDEVLAWCGIAC
jgi:putative hydrolase of the HAD superfamily